MTLIKRLKLMLNCSQSFPPILIIVRHVHINLIKGWTKEILLNIHGGGYMYAA